MNVFKVEKFFFYLKSKIKKFFRNLDFNFFSKEISDELK